MGIINIRASIPLALIFSLWYGNSYAQISHYWTEQFGTKSMLLGGSVVGGVEDLGAVYYNPARLAQIENPAFVMSASVYEWRKSKFKDAFGESSDVSQSDFGGYPSFVGGTFGIRKLKRHRFAYSYLQRHRLDSKVGYRNEVDGDLFDELSGDENFSGSVDYRSVHQEDWASLTWSYMIGDMLSIGVTATGVIYEQRRRVELTSQLLTDADHVASYRYNRNFSMDKYGFLSKIGLATSIERWRLGITFTTPLINVFGDGKFEHEEFSAGAAEIADVDDLYTIYRQSDIDSRIHTPWSVAVGATYLINKNKIHFSAEYFGKVPYYELLSTNVYQSQSSGEEYYFLLFDELKGVLNAGIGIEFYLQESISLFGSFNTDFSAVRHDVQRFEEQGLEASNSTIMRDFYHYSGGAIFDFEKANITLGFSYSGGKQSFARPVDIPPIDLGFRNPSDTYGSAKIQRWIFVISFSVPFFNEKYEQIKGKL